MTWIRTIPFEEAEGKVKDLYERIKGPNNNCLLYTSDAADDREV